MTTLIIRKLPSRRRKVKMKTKTKHSQCCLVVFLLALPALLVNCDSRTGSGSPFEPLDLANQNPSTSKHPNRPQFEARQANVVVASRWQTEVFLPCRILGLDEEQTVSWIRKRDALVLTVDRMKLSDDSRIQLAASADSQNWTLVFRQPSESDAGLYECQVSSVEPKLSRLVELRMVEATSRISNLTQLYLRPNEVLKLTCSIQAPQQTDFVYWYKNKQPIQFDNLKQRSPSVAVAAATNVQMSTSSSSSSKRSQWSSADEQVASPSAAVRSSSTLLIKRLQPNDTANYTCLPSNARPSHINVLVIENEVQNQPEKRSLLAIDGAYSQTSSIRQLRHLIKLMLLKVTCLLTSTVSNNVKNDILKVKEEEFTLDQSTYNIILKIVSSEDSLRMITTVLTTLYLWNRHRNH